MLRRPVAGGDAWLSDASEKNTPISTSKARLSRASFSYVKETFPFSIFDTVEIGKPVLLASSASFQPLATRSFFTIAPGVASIFTVSIHMIGVSDFSIIRNARADEVKNRSNQQVQGQESGGQPGGLPAASLWCPRATVRRLCPDTGNTRGEPDAQGWQRRHALSRTGDNTGVPGKAHACQRDQEMQAFSI
jgi:hypothetical protein